MHTFRSVAWPFGENYAIYGKIEGKYMGYMGKYEENIWYIWDVVRNMRSWTLDLLLSPNATMLFQLGLIMTTEIQSKYM